MTELRAPAGLRLLALDIDGTIAPEEGLPPGHVVAAINEVHASGVEIMLVTGRPVHAVWDVAALLDLDELWVGSSNGAVTSVREGGDWRTVATETFDPRPAVAAALAADPHLGIVIEEAGHGFRVSRPMPSAIGQEPHLPWITVPASTTFAALASQTLTLESLVALTVDNGANVMPWTCDQWRVADLQPAHVSKATAVQALAHQRGLSARECAAVGDYLNDVDMLAWVGWGVAMGHAPPEVKAAADAVAPSLEEDGILAVTEAILAARA